MVGETFTPGKIIRWLRGYAEWREEVDAGIGVYGSSVQGELASYRRGGYPGGPTARAAVRYVDLSERVRTVEWWLGQLEPWERLAAEYWMECRTLPAVAEELGIEYRQARRLIEVLPVVIWMRAQRGIESDSL